jgi:RNA polymerase sigma-70 factor, ECF subfamily
MDDVPAMLPIHADGWAIRGIHDVTRPRLRAIEGGASAARRPDPGPKLSESELFEGIVRGDERVAVELYKQLLPAVEGSLLRVFGRRESDHEDLVQIAFEQIIVTLSKRRYAQACSLTTWASSIAAHVALKALRSRYRQRRVFDVFAAPETVSDQHSHEDVEGNVASRERVERVRRELSQLAPPKAEAVLLHDVLGHGLLEIAAMTGVSVTAAQTRLSRGRRELAARLGRDADEERLDP